MPIKQERMLALIDAAEDFEQALTKLVQLIVVEVRGAKRATQTLDDALDHISSAAQIVFLLKNPMQSPATIAIEAGYFKTNQRRNAKAAEWQAKKRAEARGQGYGLSTPKEPAVNKPKGFSLSTEQRAVLDAEAEAVGINLRAQEVEEQTDADVDFGSGGVIQEE